MTSSRAKTSPRELREDRDEPARRDTTGRSIRAMPQERHFRFRTLTFSLPHTTTYGAAGR